MDKVTLQLTRNQISHISFALGVCMGWLGRLDIPDNKNAPELSQRRTRAYSEIIQILEDCTSKKGAK